MVAPTCTFTLDTTDSFITFAQECLYRAQERHTPTDVITLVFEFRTTKSVAEKTSSYRFRESAILGYPVDFKESFEKISDFVRGASLYTTVCTASAYNLKHKVIPLRKEVS